jgi:uncharacterized iron-regulated membrane protein
MRRVVRQVHLWMGLTLGALFALLGVTGSALVFYPEIDALLHPEIRFTASAAPDWDHALATVRRAYPDKTGPWRFEITGTGGAIPARYNTPPETAGQDFAPMLVWLAPDGTQVLRRDYWGDTAMTFVYDLHYRLLMGKTGAAVLGIAGLALIVLLITGLIVWWPKGSLSKALRYKRRAPSLRRWRDQHKLVGLSGLILLLLLTGTGVMLELPDESDTVLSTVAGPPQPLPAPTSAKWEGRQIRVATAIHTARIALPAARLAWIEVPGPGDGKFRLRMQQPGDPSRRFPHSFVWVDQYSGRVLAVCDRDRAGRMATINSWIHPLHDGSVAGLTSRILIVIAGLLPLVLFWTGIAQWRRKRLSRQIPRK